MKVTQVYRGPKAKKKKKIQKETLSRFWGILTLINELSKLCNRNLANNIFTVKKVTNYNNVIIKFTKVKKNKKEKKFRGSFIEYQYT